MRYAGYSAAMKSGRPISLLLLTLLLIAGAAGRVAALEVAPGPTPPPAAATGPWNRPPTALPPLWATTVEDIGVTLWAAPQDAGLAVVCAVRDPVQDNTFSGGQLWRGDCFYLAFDGRGDSLQNGESSDPDDGVVLLGLGAEGPQGIVTDHGSGELQGPLPAEAVAIRRDEAAATTTYQVTLPWSLLRAGKGIADTVGLAATVAHKTKAGADLHWGRARSGAAGPRALQPVPLPLPPGEFATVAAGRDRLVRRDSRSATVVAARVAAGAMPVELVATLGDAEERLALVADGDGVVRATVVVAADEVSRPGEPLRVVLGRGDATLADQSTAMTSTAANVAELLGRLDAELATLAARPPAAGPDPASWHLLSLRLLWAEIDGQTNLLATDTAWLEKVMRAASLFLGGVPEDGFALPTHLAAGLPLVLAFVSHYDGSLQFATVQLPPDWSAATAYPLAVYLHGAGPERPIDFLMTAVDNSHQDTLWRRGPTGGDREPQRECVLLAPFGRGTQGYLGPAESDVWQAMEELQRRVKTDPDRRYITGFSMGCHGAWRLANLRPDVWAGINLAAGFGDWSSTADPAMVQARGLPVAVWCGELDPMIDGGRAFAAAVPAGTPTTAVFAPGVPHTYPYREYGKMLAWLFAQRRPAPPRQFTFATPDRHYAGRNGVWMNPTFRYWAGVSASMTCAVEGQGITATTENCQGLRIEPARLGLDPTRAVTVVWNGKQVYMGTPGTEPIAVGEPGRPLHFYGADLP